MTSLERAKQFLANQAKKLAMVAVPLAAIAVASTPAQATPAYTEFLLGLCDYGQTGTVTHVAGGTCGADVQPDQGNGANGVKVWGTHSWSVTGSGSGTGYIYWTGTASGDLTLDIPVSWDFDVTQSGSGTLGWSLNFYINEIVQATSSGSGTGHFESSLIFPGPPVAAPTSWGVVFGFTITGGFGTFGVNIPQNSIDLNDPSVTAVPEPASLLLVVPGLGYLVLRRRKQRPTEAA